MPAAQNAFDVGSSSASMVFSFALVSFTVGVLLGPLLFGHLPERLRLASVAALAAAGLAASGQAATFAMFVMAYGVAFGFASGALYSHAIAHASASGHPMILVPVSVATFGLGGVVFGSVHVWLSSSGWALWSVLPALVCLVVVMLVSLFGERKGQENKGKLAASLRLVKPDRTILLLWALFATGSCSGLIVLGLASKFLMADPGSAATAVIAVSLGNTLGRLTAASVSLRFGPLLGIVMALLLSVAALVGLSFAGSSIAITALLLLVAFAYGQVASHTPLLVASHFSEPAFASVFGWVFTGWGFAGLLGPWGAGWLLEKTGDLRPALFICVGLCLVGLWLVTRLPEPQSKFNKINLY